jgi:hypothetical protein
MKWTKLNFGKHKGKTLPQIIFTDADWFFWAYENNIFDNKKIPQIEYDTVFQRATKIKPIPNNYVKHFLHDDKTSYGFSFIKIKEAEESYPEYIGGGYYDKDYHNLDATYFTILKYIDLSFPRRQKQYDKRGCKEFVDDLKVQVLDIKRITKTKAEEFFSNENNFVVSLES